MFHPHSPSRWFNPVSIKPATSVRVAATPFFLEKRKQFPSTPGLVWLLLSKSRPYQIILGPISDYLETLPLPHHSYCLTPKCEKGTIFAEFVVERNYDEKKHSNFYILFHIYVWWSWNRQFELLYFVSHMCDDHGTDNSNFYILFRICVMIMEQTVTFVRFPI